MLLFKYVGGGGRGEGDADCMHVYAFFSYLCLAG